jgi:chitin disaccharide deacetylase
MPRRRTGLLIVNADDFGLDDVATDAILECFDAGAITSTTALVWMSDSDRAAEMATRADLPVGLHLNLIEPFTAPDVPAATAATQLRVAMRMRSGGPRALLFDPRWSHDFETCITDQLSRFRELYGRPPTHVDGHRHMHLALNALFARALGDVPCCRRAVNRLPHESPAHRQLGRTVLSQLVRVRFLTTDWCYSLSPLHPALGGHGIGEKLRLSHRGSIELIVHPGYPGEFEALRAPEWPALLAGRRLGSFEALLRG